MTTAPPMSVAFQVIVPDASSAANQTGQAKRAIAAVANWGRRRATAISAPRPAARAPATMRGRSKPSRATWAKPTSEHNASSAPAGGRHRRTIIAMGTASASVVMSTVPMPRTTASSGTKPSGST